MFNQVDNFFHYNSAMYLYFKTIIHPVRGLKMLESVIFINYNVHSPEPSMSTHSNTLLAGKVALITGAGQGVGQGIAFALAKAGAKVALAGRTLSKVEDSCEQVKSFGGDAIAVECDV